MEIKRNYRPKDINWKLIPDLMRKVQESIPEDELKEMPDKLEPSSLYKIETFSQKVNVRSGGEFVNFVKETPELPVQVSVELECLRVVGTMEPYSIDPPYLRFYWNRNVVRISFSRTEAETAFRLMRDIEETLELSPAEPIRDTEKEEKKRQLRRTAFIARAFTDVGRSYAFQLTKFLSLLGFEVATGEGYSPERVSDKVKRRLTAQQIVIVVLSKQGDVTWLTQEMSGAEFAGKPIVLLVEQGVEFKPGVLGDIEYIQFPEGEIAASFAPILEGLRELGFAFK